MTVEVLLTRYLQCRGVYLAHELSYIEICLVAGENVELVVEESPVVLFPEVESKAYDQIQL